MKRRNKKIINNKIKNILSNQKGMALLTTLIFVFVLVTLAVALLTMTNNDTKMSTLQRESNKAFYLADAGIEDALWKLNTTVENGGEGIDWRPNNEPDPGTATEYYQVTIVDDGYDADGDKKIKITSTGTVIGGKFSSGKRKIEVKAEIDYVTKIMYKYAILADKIILFQGTPGPNVVGDVHSNDDILVSGHFADTYPDTSSATCSGDTNDISPGNIGAGTVTIPSVNYNIIHDPRDDLEYKAIQNGKVHDDDVIVSGEVLEWSGIHYIKGDLEVKNGAGINVNNGAIIVEGNVDVKNGATFNIINDDTYINPDDPSTALALVAQGNIKIYAKAEIREGVVQSILADGVTTEGFIELKNGCSVTGAVIADTVYLRNKSVVNYPPSGMDAFTTKGDPFFKKTSWREVY